MAIVQISRITQRKGLQENLPQLAGAEFGWCIDSRRLYIGNGTLQEGAPIIGNTEILTEFSDITVLSSYTYQDIAVGYAAQTGPTSSDPVVRTVQAKLDDFASVRDFGATGDGVTDDTEAINRALYQLYCRETNTQIRRSLFFPAGTYKVTETILIPTYAKLVGEGARSSVIYLDTSSDISTLSSYVARTADSLQQIGANIGSNGATLPRDIEISSLGFQTVETTDVFLCEDVVDSWFSSCSFIGPLTAAQIADAGFDPAVTNISGVRFESTAQTCQNITFDKCQFASCTYGIDTDQVIEGVAVTDSDFSTLYRGVVTDTNPTGFRVTSSQFDAIHSEGILYQSNLNASAHNIFYNVGNGIEAGTPISPVISFTNVNNVSVGDLFERTAADNQIEPRVAVSSTVAASGGSQITLGDYTRENGQSFTLVNNVSGQTIFQVNSLDVKAFTVDYTIVRSTLIRKGTFTVVTGPSDDSTSTVAFTDDYTENFDTGITLNATEASNTITVSYSSTNLGYGGTLTYSITHLA